MKKFPLQRPLRSDDWEIGWFIAEEAYKEYKARYPRVNQSLERLAERGGFGCIEIIELLFDRIVRIARE